MQTETGLLEQLQQVHRGQHVEGPVVEAADEHWWKDGESQRESVLDRHDLQTDLEVEKTAVSADRGEETPLAWM